MHGNSNNEKEGGGKVLFSVLLRGHAELIFVRPVEGAIVTVATFGGCSGDRFPGSDQLTSQKKPLNRHVSAYRGTGIFLENTVDLGFA